MYESFDTTLDRLRPGEFGRITKISHGRRMRDLGFTEGADIKCVLESPSRAMTAYFISGTVTALRQKDAQSIEIERNYKTDGKNQCNAYTRPEKTRI